MMEEREEKRSQAEIFTRLRGGEAIPMDDPDYGQIRVAVNQTFDLLVKLNQCPDLDKVRAYLSEIIGQSVDESTTVFPPFHTNFGRHITLGKHVFINHACSFLDLGGIVIDDHVMIGPRVNISSENHPIEAAQRKTLVPGTVHIRQNAWIGAGATLLPGITIGENAVVAAGAVVTQDVAPNTVVGGVPARKIKETG